jgi:sugar phosphate isomerase/epimerase
MGKGMTLMKTSFCSIAYKHQSNIGILEIIQDVAAAHYDGVEIWWPHVEGKSAAELLEVKSAAFEQKLTIPILSPYLGNFNLPMTNYDEMILRTRTAAPVAEKLGAPLLRAFVGWTCECSSLTASEEYWQYNLKGFREMASIAAGFGRTIVLETHSMTLVDSVAGIRRMIEDENGDDRLRLNFQLDNLAENSKLADGVAVYEAIKKWVVHMHVHRTEVGSAKFIELGRIFTAMRANRFDGFLSIEEHCAVGASPHDAVIDGKKMISLPQLSA